eukprot:gnl/MRDRNA2_/MRDRNA2_95159_c0_seq1.p1 gnl/MRDRNA2_/MRDRNA2_95159_c0~~gnl/MRDRNA2_/MRDRNA2_95159_c0_seq1.p1  ORF type:complete len:323 (+),score=70.82 gnl/MRDRNA2_/MRDRNA2_95159_c0_seq1:71-1039(+)
METGRDPDLEEEEEEESDNELDLMPDDFQRPEGQIMTARSSVSAEAYGAWNQKRVYNPVVIPKTEEQRARLKEVLLRSILFFALEPKDLEIVIDAMKEMYCEPGTRIITQGEDGDFLCVLEQGIMNCLIYMKETGEEIVVKTVESGDAVGELALLYNCPRAASVESATQCTFWQLDRETFNHIVKDASIRKRDLHDQFLQSVPLLSHLGTYERTQISDALKTEFAPANTFIIQQGEPGNTFYILEEGAACATKQFEEGGEPVLVMEYGPGSHFGELALLNNEPRAANVIARTDVKLLSIDRMSFKKMFGPLEQRIHELAPQV